MQTVASKAKRVKEGTSEIRTASSAGPCADVETNYYESVATTADPFSHPPESLQSLRVKQPAMGRRLGIGRIKQEKLRYRICDALTVKIVS